MKKLLVLLLVFCSSLLFGQEKQNQQPMRPISTTKVAALKASEQGKALSELNIFSEKNNWGQISRSDESFTLTGKDDLGTYEISMLVETYESKDKRTESLDAVILATYRNGKVEKISSWYENSKEINEYTDGQFKKSNQNAAKSSFSSCLSQYLKPGITSCSNCTNCIQNCWSQNKKWKRVVCAVKNCWSPCVACITNVIGFFNCWFN